MSHALRARRALPALGLLALAFPAFASAAPADPGFAPLNSYEQISRADGPRGATTLDTLKMPDPVFASDTGGLGAYSEAPGLLQLKRPPVTTIVRNTLTNRTTDLGTGAGKLLQADRSETIGLFRQLDVDYATNVFETTYRVGRLDGRGGFKTLPIDYQYATVVLSGNGKFVVVSDDHGLRRLNLATDVWTTISQYGAIEARSVSDDGQTIAGVDFNLETQQISAVIWKGTTRTVLQDNFQYVGTGSGPQLSSDGSTVLTLKPALEEGSKPKVSVRRLSSNRTAEFEVPFRNSYDARSIWVSPSGDRIAFALGWQSRSNPVEEPLEPAKVLNTKTGAWTVFGGPFSTSIVSSNSAVVPQTAISRNGQFAALAYNEQVAMVNLEGRPLLGNLLGTETLSASSYLYSLGLDYCGFGFSSTFAGVFTAPASWVKPPRRAHITVSNGSTVLADQNWTKPSAYPNGESGDYDGVSVQFPLQQVHTRNVKYSVVDGNGRQLNESYSATLACGLPDEG